MVALAIALVLIVVLILLVKSRGFRKVAGIAVAGIVVVTLVGFVIYYYMEQKAKSLIPITEVELSDLLLKPGSLGKLTGRVKNHSQRYTLRAIGLRIKVKDCTDKNGVLQCDVIGEAEETVSLRIPPGQVRDFKESFYLGSTTAKGQLKWEFSVLHTRGD